VSNPIVDGLHTMLFKHVNSARGRIQVTDLLRSRSRFPKNSSASLRLLSIGRLVCSFA
jgi:hypothetical protein